MLNERISAGMPFVALGVLAILVGGLIAGVTAHQPTRVILWMVAYLVLVVGMMQAVFGAGQAWLAEIPPERRVVWRQWGLYNLGNVGVIGGTLWNQSGVVTAGTLLFIAAIAWFFYGVRHYHRRSWGVAYRALLGIVFLSSCVGLVLSVA